MRCGRWGLLVIGLVGACGGEAESGAEPEAVAEPESEPASKSEPEPGPEPERKDKGGLASAVAERAAEVRAAKEVPPDVKAAETIVEPQPDEPIGLAPPTEAEFKAWDRKDPETEKHLYKWDTANLDTMLGYIRHLECRRLAMIEAGESFEAGTSSESDWTDFKRDEILGLHRWQKQLFSDHPRIAEKSKFIGQILELHELVTYELPTAFNAKDAKARAKADAHWAIVIAKVDRYTKTLGGEWKDATADDCKDEGETGETGE